MIVSFDRLFGSAALIWCVEDIGAVSFGFLRVWMDDETHKYAA